MTSHGLTRKVVRSLSQTPAPQRIIPPPPAGWPCWEALMNEALTEAHLARAKGEVPVGAVLVTAEGRIAGRGHNCPITASDPSAHAEILALRRAGAALGNYRLGGCFLVVTLEPCLMCAGSLVHARLAGVVYGAPDPKAGAIASCADSLEWPFHPSRVWHMGGILEKECAALLTDFFTRCRE